MNEALIARGGIPVELDRERTLFFDMYAGFALQGKYGEEYMTALYRSGKDRGGKPKAMLKSVDALAYFLWQGLLAECRGTGEKLTQEQVADWIMPGTLQRIFDAVTAAVVRGIHTPPLPGKAEAATASPAAAAKPGASPSRKRSASPTPSSTGRRSSSGAAR